MGGVALKNSIYIPTARVAMPVSPALIPINTPRLPFETVLPNTSFADTEHKPLAKLKITKAISKAQPAIAPLKDIAVTAINKSASPDSPAPNSQTPFRFGRLRTAAATNS